MTPPPFTANRSPLGGSLSRRGFLSGAAAFGAIAALSACGTGGAARSGAFPGLQSDAYTGPPITLRFWNGLGGSDGELMNDMCRQFGEETGNIRVEMYRMPWSVFYQKFPAASVSGLAPDIGLMQSFQVATNAARGVLAPLDDVMDRIGLRADQFERPVWEAGAYQGARYGIPLDIWPDSLFYNKRVLEQAGLDPESPPQDNESYLSALDAMASKDIRGHWLPAIDPQGVGRGFDSLQWQFGGELYSDDGTEPRFDSDAGRKALDWQVNLVKQGFSPKNVGGGDATTAFKNDLNAFIWGGPGAYVNDLSSVDTLDWGVAPLPNIGGRAAAFTGSHNLFLANQQNWDDDRITASVQFLKWISDHSILWAGAGLVPARIDVQESAEFQALGPQRAIASGLDAVRLYPPIPGIFDVQTATVYQAASDAILLRATPQAALSDAAGQASGLLLENSTKYAQKS